MDIWNFCIVDIALKSLLICMYYPWGIWGSVSVTFWWWKSAIGVSYQSASSFLCYFASRSRPDSTTVKHWQASSVTLNKTILWVNVVIVSSAYCKSSRGSIKSETMTICRIQLVPIYRILKFYPNYSPQCLPVAQEFNCYKCVPSTEKKNLLYVNWT